MCVYINQKNRITVPKPAFDPLPLSSPSYRIYVISELVAIYRSYVHGRFCSMVVHAFTTNATHLYLEPIQDEKRVLSQYQHIRGYLFRLSGFVLATRQYNVFHSHYNYHVIGKHGSSRLIDPQLFEAISFEMTPDKLTDLSAIDCTCLFMPLTWTPIPDRLQRILIDSFRLLYT
ncbi:hypothetical protein WA538_000419 [Blastocystis sp. DL]